MEKMDFRGVACMKQNLVFKITLFLLAVLFIKVKILYYLPFYRQFEAQYALMQEVGTPTERIVLQDWPHGFGADGGWVKDYAKWLETIFQQS